MKPPKKEMLISVKANPGDPNTYYLTANNRSWILYISHPQSLDLLNFLRLLANLVIEHANDGCKLELRFWEAILGALPPHL